MIANKKLMRKWNRQLVLSIVRNEGSLSQIDIIRRSGLSAGTVVNITRQLRKENFLKPIGKGPSLLGRRPVILKFNSSARYVLSALCLEQQTQIALVDLAGVIAARTSFPTNPQKGVKIFLEKFNPHLIRLLKSNEVSMKQVMALCVSFDGMVDARTGTLLDCVRLGWKNIPFRDYFQKQLGLDVCIEDINRTAAFGEHIFGVGRPYQNIVYLTLGSGIGASIIHEGRIFHGAHQMEGEIGHTVMEPGGPLCRCGKHGCLEALAAGPAVIAAARAALLPGLREIHEMDSESENYHLVLNLARQGDIKALEIIKKVAGWLGHTVANLINLLDTELIVLAGYMVENNADFFLEMIRNAAQAAWLENARRKVNIVKGSLGKDEILIGGAMFACQKAFSMPQQPSLQKYKNCEG